MVLFSRDIGLTTKPVDMVHSGMQREIFTLDNSGMTRQMGWGSILMSMEVGTRGSGWMMCRRGRGRRYG